VTRNVNDERRMSTPRALSTDEIAREVAMDLPDNSYVNLGIGMPQRVSTYAVGVRGIVLHSENGILGLGPAAEPSDVDPDLIDAGKVPVTLAVGGSYTSHTDSFAIIRGGHLDACVLGGFQVSTAGDLANWNDGEGVPSVGGAMDLALGARIRIVMMRHNDRQGRAKFVHRLTLPLTAKNCVTRAYTELGVFEPSPDGLRVLALTDGVSKEMLRQRTEADVLFGDETKRLPRIDGDAMPYASFLISDR